MNVPQWFRELMYEGKPEECIQRDYQEYQGYKEEGYSRDYILVRIMGLQDPDY